MSTLQQQIKQRSIISPMKGPVKGTQAYFKLSYTKRSSGTNTFCIVPSATHQSSLWDVSWVENYCLYKPRSVGTFGKYIFLLQFKMHTTSKNDSQKNLSK